MRVLIIIAIFLFKVLNANAQFSGTVGDGFVMTSANALSLSFDAMYSGGLADGFTRGSANNQSLGSLMARMGHATDQLSDVEEISVEEVSVLSIYPNPSSAYFTLSGDQLKEFNDQVVITLSDMNGRKLFVREVDKNSKIFFQTIPAGLYILNVSDSGKSQSLKLHIEN